MEISSLLLGWQSCSDLSMPLGGGVARAFAGREPWPVARHRMMVVVNGSAVEGVVSVGTHLVKGGGLGGEGLHGSASMGGHNGPAKFVGTLNLPDFAPPRRPCRTAARCSAGLKLAGVPRSVELSSRALGYTSANHWLLDTPGYFRF